jgi:hypothetical protein
VEVKKEVLDAFMQYCVDKYMPTTSYRPMWEKVPSTQNKGKSIYLFYLNSARALPNVIARCDKDGIFTYDCTSQIRVKVINKVVAREINIDEIEKVLDLLLSDPERLRKVLRELLNTDTAE